MRLPEETSSEGIDPFERVQAFNPTAAELGRQLDSLTGFFISLEGVPKDVKVVCDKGRFAPSASAVVDVVKRVSDLADRVVSKESSEALRKGLENVQWAAQAAVRTYRRDSLDDITEGIQETTRQAQRVLRAVAVNAKEPEPGFAASDLGYLQSQVASLSHHLSQSKAGFENLVSTYEKEGRSEDVKKIKKSFEDLTQTFTEQIEKCQGAISDRLAEIEQQNKVVEGNFAYFASQFADLEKQLMEDEKLFSSDASQNPLLKQLHTSHLREWRTLNSQFLLMREKPSEKVFQESIKLRSSLGELLAGYEQFKGSPIQASVVALTPQVAKSAPPPPPPPPSSQTGSGAVEVAKQKGKSVESKAGGSFPINANEFVAQRDKLRKEDKLKKEGEGAKVEDPLQKALKEKFKNVIGSGNDKDVEEGSRDWD